MTIIERIQAKIAKLAINAKTRDHVAALVEAAYQAGRRDGVTDVRITLEDDMVNDDHSKALEVINANW